MILQTVFALVFMIGQGAADQANPGQLTVIDRAGKPGILCPLKGTKVDMEIEGFGARVTLVQTFTNPTKETIEALYTFPLPAEAAVDSMRIKVQDRISVGQIMRREDAEQTYAAARAAGQTAVLLNQERPNIFTQSVANISPGAEVQVEISYVQLLKFENGVFEISFPMVVGPRYVGVGGNAPDSGQLNPKTYVPSNTRSGANIEINARIVAGAPITFVQSALHQINSSINGRSATVNLRKQNEIPNRDFILQFGVQSNQVNSQLLTYADGTGGGYFSLILMPPNVTPPADVSPREIIFVVDQSGSQGGMPIEKSKILAAKLIRSMGPKDSFNVLTFSNQTHKLWAEPMPNTEANQNEALKLIAGLHADGGTQLLDAVTAAMSPDPQPDRLRVVLFLTDGFVGNDFDILAAVQKYRDNARLFTFGIGNSVNRFLIDGMSAEGRGDSEIVTLESDADAAVKRLVQRVSQPLLTDVSVSINGLQISDQFPKLIPDVFSAKPIVVWGRYEKGGRGEIVLSGQMGGTNWTKSIDVTFPDEDKTGSAIPSLWARQYVDELMREDYMGMAGANGTQNEKQKERIIEIALKHNIMTQYTSFVAVDKKVVNIGGKLRTVDIPVETPSGVSFMDSPDNMSGGPPASMGTGGVGRGRTGGGRASGFGGGGAGGGLGGGGFGGSGFGGGLAADKAPVREIGEKSAEAKMTPEEKLAYRMKTRLHTKLRNVKSGDVDVQIKVKAVSPELLAKLKSLGFTIAASDSDLKVVFGTCDVKVLKALVMMDSVVFVSPI